MNKKQKENLTRLENNLCKMGIRLADVRHLLRIERALNRWHAMECGTRIGKVDVYVFTDVKTGHTMKRVEHRGNDGNLYTNVYRTRNAEATALKQLRRLMLPYCDTLVPYVQSDPRGCSLYILRKSDVAGADISSVYTRGVAVCI